MPRFFSSDLAARLQRHAAHDAAISQKLAACAAMAVYAQRRPSPSRHLRCPRQPNFKSRMSDILSARYREHTLTYLADWVAGSEG